MFIPKPNPLITIYITNYNYGKYIKESIESVLNQTCQDFELIIIDDGSTDNSKEIINSYSNNEKIRIIFQNNKGLNITNNIALRVARGKFIMRLDADDYLDSNALLVMSNIISKDDELGLIFPDYFLVDADGNVLSVAKRHSFDNNVSLLDQPAHGACTMIRKKFLQILGGYDEQFKCQDGYELWIKFTKKYKVTNVNTPLFYYRQHGLNLTSDERKILNTRASIKDKYIKKNGFKNMKSVAIIPVRGSKYKSNNVVFTKLNDKYVIDWKIDEALKSEKISLVVVSSPDEKIEEHVLAKYGENTKIKFHKREEELARLNIDLTQTINNILKQDYISEIDPQILVVLSVENPFVKSAFIDDAINSMNIFKTDSLISVRQETSMFFQHDGGGMKPILNQEKFSKLEREALYKYSGGIIAVKTSQFMKSLKLISGTVGHIVIDEQSAHVLKTKYDVKIAQFLAKQEPEV
ncbi:MAG: hypothetical protein DRJ01_02995 [Bacteroidetes bacterium]|nr:MAG: hypothetical protein DRJ01_02995 [Bacteroidota bacterium]